MRGGFRLSTGVLLAGAIARAEAPVTEEPRVRPSELRDTDVGTLAREVAHVRRHFARLGRVQRQRPRLVERGAVVPLILNESATEPRDDRCTTVVALGTRNVSFLLQFDPSTSGPRERAFPVPSSAGVAEVTRCGDKRPILASIGLQMRSPRGVIEFLVLESDQTPPPIAEILPSRDAGSSLAAPQIGPRPRGAPPAERAAAQRAENAGYGARAGRLLGIAADRAGQGQLTLHLAIGCHQLDLLAPVSSDGAPDLDARLTSVQDGSELVRDESESANARLRFCVGRADRFLLAIQGAPPGSEATLVHGEWDLPRGLPIEWGPVARAELARVLWKDRPPVLPDPPVWAGLGVQGSTDVWFPARPGACYWIGASRMRGELTRLVLEADAGATTAQSFSGPDQEGAMLSLCSEGSDRIHVRVHSLGPGLAWLLAAWEFPMEAAR